MLIVIMYLCYRPFHKTLPKSSLQMYWISVRFYEMGCIISHISQTKILYCVLKNIFVNLQYLLQEGLIFLLFLFI